MAGDTLIDTSGLSCPIPILKAKKTLTGMASGAVLEVVATDPAAPKDFIAFCKATGHELLETAETEGTWRIRIRRQ